MSQTLLIALALTLPFSALAGLAALAVERTGPSLALRLITWRAAFLLPMLIVPVMLATAALGVRSPLALAEAQPQSATSAPRLANPRSLSAPEIPKPGISIQALILATLAAGALLRLTGLAIGLRRVSQAAADASAIDDPLLVGHLGPGVRQGDVATPILAGLARPVILLPRKLVAGLTVEQTILVCAHERALHTHA